MSSLRDKVFGSYIGAAIGDALGGPVQAMHYQRIQKLFGGIKTMLPYRKPPGFFDVGPGYAMHSEPASVTDETLVGAQIAHFVSQHPRSRTATELVTHLFRYGNFKVWPPRLIEPLRRLRERKDTVEITAKSVPPGGGLGWWTAIGIANAGRPDRAAVEASRLAAIWKRPLEQDLLAALQAGVAQALTERATPDSVVAAARTQIGPLTDLLIERAASVARSVPRGNVNAFLESIYSGALVGSIDDEVDGFLPPPAPISQNIDAPCISTLFAEAVPLAFAALLFGDGRSRITLLAAASLGRDSKCIGAATGALIGALVGRSRLPREWVGAVVTANQDEADLVQLANDLADELEPKFGLTDEEFH